MQTKRVFNGVSFLIGAVVLSLLVFGLSYGTQTYQLWYLDADADGYSDGTTIIDDTQPGTGYVTKDALLIGNATTLEITAFLGALYDSGTELMRDDLRLAGPGYDTGTVLPLSDPFTAFGYTVYTETGAVLGDVLDVTGEDAFVDRVLVEFRDDADASHLVATKLGYIQRDGDIVDVDGSELYVPVEDAGSYYISVKHRSHMRVMTANPVSVGNNNVSIDFTNPATTTYGTDSQRDVEGITVMRMGDLTNDDVIDEDDENKIDAAFGSGINGDYFEEDVVTDGVVDGDDAAAFAYRYSVFSGSTGLPAIDTNASNSAIDRSSYSSLLSQDCDDSDDAVYPGASEICDSVDNDCDGDIDTDDSGLIGGTTYYQDSDGDGYGNASVSQTACSTPANYVVDDNDCDDADDAIHPGATELVANEIDEDCDAQEECYEDGDSDGYGTTSTVLSSSISCEGSGVSLQSTDCDDADVFAHPNQVRFYDSDDDGYSEGTYSVACLSPGSDRKAAGDAETCTMTAIRADFTTGSVNQYDLEFPIQGSNLSNTFGEGGIEYLFTDTDGNHRLGGAAAWADNGGSAAGAGVIWAVTSSGTMVAGSFKQFSTGLSLQASDYFGQGGIEHLFTDTSGNHWLGGGAYGEDTAGSDAGAAFIRAVNDDGNLVAGSIKQYDTELALEAGDSFGQGRITYLFTDGSGHHRLGGGAPGEDTAASNAGAVFIRAVNGSGTMVTGSVKQYDTEFSLQASDTLGWGGVDHLFTDGDGKHWLGAGAYGADTAASNAGAAIIWAVDDSGNLITGSITKYDSELSLQANDGGAKWGVEPLFTDADGNQRVGIDVPLSDTLIFNGGAGIIWALDPNGNFVTGSVRQFDDEFSMGAGMGSNDIFGEGGINYLFTDTLLGYHWLAGGAPSRDTAATDAGAAIVRAVDDNGIFVTGSVQQYDTELSLQFTDGFGYGGIVHLFTNASGEHRLGGAARYEDTNGSNAGAAIIWSVTVNPVGSCEDTDCNDADNTVYPGATETCDGEDSNCDGTVSLPVTSYQDGDDDGYGNSAVPVTQCLIPEGYVNNDEDCDDVDAEEKPGQFWFNDSDSDEYITDTYVIACERPGGTRVSLDDENNSCVAGELEVTMTFSGQYDTELSVQAVDVLGGGGVTYLFTDDNGNRRVGAGAYGDDTAAADAGAALIWAINESGSVVAGSVKQFDTELSLQLYDNFAQGGMTYLFMDDDGNHRLGAGVHAEDTAGSTAGAGIIRAVNGSGNFITGSVKQFDTELSLQSDDNFGVGGISYLFTDTGGNHRLGGGAIYEDTAASNAGAGIIRAVDDNGNFVTGSVKQYDTELSLQANDYFGQGGIKHLFTDAGGNHRLGGGAMYEDTAASDAGAGIIRAVDDNGNFVTGSVKQYDTELSLQSSDYFGLGGVSHLFTDDEGNHRLGGGAYAEDTAGGDAGAAFIWAVDDNGNFVTGSVKQFDTELSLQTSDAFARRGVRYLFEDVLGNRRLGATAYNEDTAGSDAGAAIIRAIDDDGTFVTGSVQQYDTELGLQSQDNLGYHGMQFLFTGDDGRYRLGAGAAGEDTAASNAGAAFVWAISAAPLIECEELDCDDTDDTIYPSATETCNGVDANCDGTVSTPVTGYQDDDADGFGNGDVFMTMCAMSAGYVTNDNDCDDTDADEKPGQYRFQDGDSDDYTNGSMQVSCERPGAQWKTYDVINTCEFVPPAPLFLETKKYTTELAPSTRVEAVTYLFTDTSGNHRVGGGSSADSTIAVQAGAVLMRALDDNGDIVAGSVKQYDSELGAASYNNLGRGGINYLFEDEEGDHRIGATTPGKHGSTYNGGAVLIWAVDDNGELVSGKLKRIAADLALQAFDNVGYGGVKRLFTDNEGNHRLGTSTYKRGTAGSNAGVAIMRAVDDDGNFVSGSLREYETELGLQSQDNFGYYGIEHLFTDTDGNHRLGGGARGEDTAGDSAGAAIIWAVNDDGNFVTGSVKQFDTELGLTASSYFGEEGVTYLFTDNDGNHRLGDASYRISTAGNSAGAAIIWAVDDDGTFVEGSTNQFDTELELDAFDALGEGGLSFLFTDSGGNHRLGAAANADDTISNGGAAIIRAVNDAGEMVEDSLVKLDTELGVTPYDFFGRRGINYLYASEDGNKRFGGASSNATYIRSLEFSPPVRCEDIDCNDGDAAIHPGATEVCDEVDNDCDEEIDELRECSVSGRSGSTTTSNTVSGTKDESGSEETTTDAEDVESDEVVEDTSSAQEEGSDAQNPTQNTSERKTKQSHTSACLDAFVDVPKDAEFYEAVREIHGECTLVEGETKYFQPYRIVTKGELYSMIAALFYENDVAKLSENEELSVYAALLVKKGVLEKYTESELTSEVRLSEVVQVVVSVLTKQNNLNPQKDIPVIQNDRLVRRFEAVSMLKKIADLMKQ